MSPTTIAKEAGETAGWFVPGVFIITINACGIGISVGMVRQFIRDLREFTGGNVFSL